MDILALYFFEPSLVILATLILLPIIALIYIRSYHGETILQDVMDDLISKQNKKINTTEIA